MDGVGTSIADSPAIAHWSGAQPEHVHTILRQAEREGCVQYLAFADLAGWSLTEAGKAENERLLATERRVADPDDVIAAVYRDFLPLNSRLLSAVTDWQIKPTADDHFAPNHHTNRAWDTRILEELVALGQELAPLSQRLCAVAERFHGYVSRYQAALHTAQAGQHDWVDKTEVDSCHRVWFQLHEDLVATLGIDRLNDTHMH